MGNLNAIEVFYWLAFLAGLGYALVGLLAGGLGGGHEVDAGGGAGLEHEVSLDHGIQVEHEVSAEAAGHDVGEAAVHVSVFNSLTIAAFLAALGGLGLIGLKFMALNTWLSFGFAFVGALLLAAILFLAVVRPLYRSENSSSPSIEAVLRAPARVRESIPIAGTGEIEYVAGGSRSVMPARAEDEEKGILKGTEVAILRVRKGVAYVVPLFDEAEQADQPQLPSG